MKVYNDVMKYRFGFNGQEKDNEVSGVGNSVSFKYRIHDTRLGRFLSVDPLAPDYPWNSPYAFAENDVIGCIDLEGLERLVVTGTFGGGAETRTRGASDWLRKTAQWGAAMQYPSAGIAVGWFTYGGTNISTNSGRTARHMGENGNMTTREGGETNAFRHVFWQATITSQFGSMIAEEFGNAHEGVRINEGVHIDWSQPLVQDLPAADDVVDFLNNDIGRQVGTKLGENATPTQIALEVLNIQRTEGLWEVNVSEGGAYTISRNPISAAQYLASLKMLQTLDNNGMTENDRKELEIEK